MNTDSRVTLRWPAVAAAAIALLAVGAGSAYLLLQKFSSSDQRMQDTARSASAPPAPEAPQSGASSERPARAPMPDVVVTVSGGHRDGDRGQGRRRLVHGEDPWHR
jgi:hypothetical protein